MKEILKKIKTVLYFVCESQSELLISMATKDKHWNPATSAIKLGDKRHTEIMCGQLLSLKHHY